MKKSLIALAVLAASGAAMAQSSVTLFGVVDAAYSVGKGSISNKTQLANSGYNSSRLGFRGVEDLGGGMRAEFWLEAGVNNDNGTGSATNVQNQAVTAANAGRHWAWWVHWANCVWVVTTLPSSTLTQTLIRSVQTALHQA